MVVPLILLSQLLLLLFLLPSCLAFPQQGVKTFPFDRKHTLLGFTKTVYNNTNLYINVNCDATNNTKADVEVSYVVQLFPCFLEEITLDEEQDASSDVNLDSSGVPYFEYESPVYPESCDGTHHIILPHEDIQFVHRPVEPPVKKEDEMNTETQNKSTAVKPKEPEHPKTKRDAAKDDPKKDKSATTAKASTTKQQNETVVKQPLVDQGRHAPQVTFASEGIYNVYVKIKPANDKVAVSGTVDIKFEGPHGYLSAVDWPLLPFYGVMCGVYVLYGLGWLVVSALHWRDLLRIQFWIGGVILLGMLEKAVFYAEYQSINSTGRSVQGAIMVAEVVSCLKRALARMLVIIVSLGFGIVKPRLGPLLHRVVGTGLLYFVLSVFESYFRVYTLKNDPNRQSLLAEMLLAVLDSFICWWIFSSLVQTTRTLRLRRNVVKLSSYRHFTNALIFAVLASVAFMVWSLTSHRRPACMTDWKELWVDEAYWRILFSAILLVIMILWRPTNNNQRYAFTPLLDPADEDEEDQMKSDAFESTKHRSSKNHVVKDNQSRGAEDDIKWVEENIPSTIADIALPSLLDSDEEIMTTKFEISKMN